MSLYVCAVCGHVQFGAAPDRCPVCFAAKEKFQPNDKLFSETAAKNPEGAEKHAPVVTVVKECGLVPESACTDVLVRVGKALHPMEPAHRINWIDCYVDKLFVSRMQLTPGVNAVACFHLKASGSTVRIIENCNLHGTWMSEAAL
jgi:desulfoferrodoxin-like iron-binding protein